MDISKMNTGELKAMAYDLVRQLNIAQQNLSVVEQRILQLEKGAKNVVQNKLPVQDDQIVD
jgi:hypothetical protein